MGVGGGMSKAWRARSETGCLRGGTQEARAKDRPDEGAGALHKRERHGEVDDVLSARDAGDKRPHLWVPRARLSRLVRGEG